jgi:hypothetical protein
MLGRISVIQDDRKAVFVEFDSPVSFKQGQQVDIKEHKRQRSLNQNRLYFGFLQWCISEDGGNLVEKGHFEVDGLHTDIKSWVQSEYPNQFNIKEIFSSATLNTKEFTEFIALVDRELMVKFFRIDTSRFWGDVEKESELPF